MNVPKRGSINSFTNKGSVDRAEDKLSPRALAMANSIKQVSARSPHITVTYNRRKNAPIGSVSPEVLRAFSQAKRSVRGPMMPQNIVANLTSGMINNETQHFLGVSVD